MREKIFEPIRLKSQQYHWAPRNLCRARSSDECAWCVKFVEFREARLFLDRRRPEFTLFVLLSRFLTLFSARLLNSPFSCNFWRRAILRSEHNSFFMQRDRRRLDRKTNEQGVRKLRSQRLRQEREECINFRTSCSRALKSIKILSPFVHPCPPLTKHLYLTSWMVLRPFTRCAVHVHTSFQYSPSP